VVEHAVVPWLDSYAPSVLYEDEDVLVIDKPAGIPCQAVDPARPDDLPTLIKRWLAQRRSLAEGDVYLGTHQRLDQDTSGSMLYTLQKAANPALAEQFAERQIEKVYLAAVSGKPPLPGTLLVHHLAPAEGGSMRVVGEREPGAKQARTRILEVQSVQDRSLIKLAIDTGRTHQVRVQLAALGCPVAGDARYGGGPALRLLLHAQRLAFRHPHGGQRIEVESPVPFELTDWLAHGARPALADPRLLDRALEWAAGWGVGLGRPHAASETTAFRLLHDAADGVAGFAVDVYDRWLVLRVDGDDFACEERALIARLAMRGVAGIYVKRHPKQANQLVDPTEDQIAPRLPVWGEAAPPELIVYEQSVPFEVRLGDGLRTGLFLDQRDNRARVRKLAQGKRVLNLFAYTGSFSVVALLGGASSVTSVDVSRTALAWADRNVARVGGTGRHRSVADDAFSVLKQLAQRGERFDVVILDPPSYSTTKRGRFRAKADYPALCAAALEVLADTGTLLACINHHGVSRSALRRFVQMAARTAGRSARILRDLPTASDFPAEPGREPAMKSVLAEFSQRAGFRSPSGSLHPKKTQP
jgi:23S rRNA (cytosine1962-C5)-methyltransferase